MDMIDNDGLREKISAKQFVRLECGTGGKKIFTDSIAIDILDIHGVDIVADLNEGFPFLGDSTVDEIVSFHFMEHLHDVGHFLKEAYRVLKIGGRIRGTVPHFTNPYYYSDYTHKHPFGLYSFSYFSKMNYYKRQVPQFYNDIEFEINKIELIFYSPFTSRNCFKMVFQKLVNMTRWTQEFYEENMCFMVPAFEIKFVIEKK